MQPTTHGRAARRYLFDATLIVVLSVAALATSDALFLFDDPGEKAAWAFGSIDAWRTHLAWWWAVAVLSAVAIPLRHQRPLAALVLAVVPATVHLLDPLMSAAPTDAAVLIALYALAGSARRRAVAFAALVATEILLGTACVAREIGVAPTSRPGSKYGTTYSVRLSKSWSAVLSGDGAPFLFNAVRGAAVPALLLAVTWAIADNARTRRAHLAVLQARADDLQREQEQRTALAVAAERGRITRELHDVVAHGLSVMVVQAQGAKAMLHRQPERTEAALGNIVTTGRASLAEMRRLLGLARTGTEARLAPQPSLATLPELVDRVRNTGVTVDFRVIGEPSALPAVLELAAYRIVQEALTNSLKHAPGAACTVELVYGPAELDVRVGDDGPAVAAPEPGNGLRGITERVRALGGELRAGPGAHHGFEVSARLPFAPDRELVA